MTPRSFSGTLATDERFASNSARVAHREAIDASIAAAFAPLTAAEVVRRLDAADIACARMNGVADFLEHPQLASRDRWRSVESPVGPLRALVPPFTFEGEATPMGPIPAVGAHTEAILKELGYDESTTETWRAAVMI